MAVGPVAMAVQLVACPNGSQCKHWGCLMPVGYTGEVALTLCDC